MYIYICVQRGMMPLAQLGLPHLVVMRVESDPLRTGWLPFRREEQSKNKKKFVGVSE